MAMDKEQFIRELVEQHKPRRPLLSPALRTLVWALIVLTGTVILTILVQTIRPGCCAQLARYPLLLVEVLTALLIVPCAAYVCFSGTVPGARVPRGARITLWCLSALLLGCLAISCAHTQLSPPSSETGHRHFCCIEVLLYGGLALAGFLVMARRGYLRFSSRRGALMGLMAGLMPAAIMQIACMYNPSHALVFHYAPTALLVCAGIVALRFLRR